MSEGTLIEKTSYDLGLTIAANIPTCGLSDEVQRYYLANKHLIPDAIRRGFVLPNQEVQASIIAPTPPKVVPASFKTADTDLDEWLAAAQRFAKTYLGLEVKLREMFVIPEELPWPSAIPVFDPGHLKNSDVIQKALRGSGLATWEEEVLVDHQYSGSGAGGPTLNFIKNSVRPDADTMGKSPNWLRDTKKDWLNLRGYALAFALYCQVTGGWLDPQTFTWFPANRLSGDRVASGNGCPGSRGVYFCWSNSDVEDPPGGARLAIPCFLKP